MEQLWTLEGAAGISIHTPEIVSVLCGKAVYLPPQQFSRIYLPYRITTQGGVSLAVGLQRPDLISGMSVTKGGMIRINVWNTSLETVCLTQKTVMVVVRAKKISIKHLGKDVKIVHKITDDVTAFGERLRDEIIDMFPSVGDLSSHPVNEAMAKLVVKASEVSWRVPRECGSRTQYIVEEVADRKKVMEQLEDYVRRGYLKEVSVAEQLYLSPLLPIRKPNGMFRFTNDFRKLNSYFPSGSGTTQVDVWRKMWEMDPTWRFFCKIDLKDGFFGVPVDEELSKLFGFSFGVRKFRWVRLPQGWKWSSVFFGERVAEILKDVECPQYSDDVLVGAASLDELREKVVLVFSRFAHFGVKVNFQKVTWCSAEITFLGHEICNGKWSFEKYLKKKMKEIGLVDSLKRLESVIGVLSYARRCIVDSERILGPLRDHLSDWKNHSITQEKINVIQGEVADAFGKALDNVRWLVLPGAKADRYVFTLESDWSSGFVGYMLFVEKDGEEKLVDIGSKAVKKATSSYLGELGAIVWACKRTKAFRGSVPLLIRTDSHAVYDKFRAGYLHDDDVRAFRKWGWLVANEPGLKLEFLAGSENKGADFLSRPHGECFSIKLRRLSTTLGPCIKTKFVISEEEQKISVTISHVPRAYEIQLESGKEVNHVLVQPIRAPDERLAEMRRLAWNEHCDGHWGPYKVRFALRQKGHHVPLSVVKQMCSQCEVCALF